MFSIPSFYELGSFSDCRDILEEVLSSPKDATANLSSTSAAEAKALAASISHKEAERRRRKRINGHMATLRSILPDTIKKDKASVLGEAVRRVKELRKTAAALDEEANANEDSLELMVPSETDELKVWHCENSGLIKATLSCQDRPEMVVDLIHALKSAEAKVVRAEMSTVGGRTKNVLWVKLVQASSEVGLGTLRKALETVMDKSTLLAGSGQLGNKRPRYYQF